MTINSAWYSDGVCIRRSWTPTYRPRIDAPITIMTTRIKWIIVNVLTSASISRPLVTISTIPPGSAENIEVNASNPNTRLNTWKLIDVARTRKTGTTSSVVQ